MNRPLADSAERLARDEQHRARTDRAHLTQGLKPMGLEGWTPEQARGLLSEIEALQRRAAEPFIMIDRAAKSRFDLPPRPRSLRARLADAIRGAWRGWWAGWRR